MDHSAYIPALFQVIVVKSLYYQNVSHHFLTYSVALVRKRTIPTERPPLVGEVNTNFCGKRVPRGQRDRPLRP
jgi:hypothetical protein